MVDSFLFLFLFVFLINSLTALWFQISNNPSFRENSSLNWKVRRSRNSTLRSTESTGQMRSLSLHFWNTSTNCRLIRPHSVLSGRIKSTEVDENTPIVVIINHYRNRVRRRQEIECLSATAPRAVSTWWCLPGLWLFVYLLDTMTVLSDISSNYGLVSWIGHG